MIVDEPRDYRAPAEVRDDGSGVRHRLNFLAAAGGQEPFPAHGDGLLYGEMVIHRNDLAVDEDPVGRFLRVQQSMTQDQCHRHRKSIPETSSSQSSMESSSNPALPVEGVTGDLIIPSLRTGFNTYGHQSTFHCHRRGGMGGLAAAATLLRSGMKVDVYEQAARFGRVGAGIQMMPNSMKVLRGIGVEDSLRKTSFKPFSHLNREWDTGRVLKELPMPEDLFGAPYLCMHRADLTDALASAVPG